MVRDPPPAVDLVQRRRAILSHLADGAESKNAIASAAGVSATTATRALWELQTARLVDRDDGTYRLTRAGRTVYEADAELAADADDILAAVPLLEHVDDPSDIEPSALIGSTVHVAAAPTPQEPVNAIADLFEGSNRVRIGSQAYTNARFPEQQTRLAVEDRAETEIIFEESVFEMAITDYPGMLEKNVREGDVRIYTIDSIPFAAGLFEHDDAVWTVLVVYGEESRVIGSITNDSPAAARWVNETLDEWRARATEVTDSLKD